MYGMREWTYALLPRRLVASENGPLSSGGPQRRPESLSRDGARDREILHLPKSGPQPPYGPFHLPDLFRPSRLAVRLLPRRRRASVGWKDHASRNPQRPVLERHHERRREGGRPVSPLGPWMHALRGRGRRHGRGPASPHLRVRQAWIPERVHEDRQHPIRKELGTAGHQHLRSLRVQFLQRFRRGPRPP